MRKYSLLIKALLQCVVVFGQIETNAPQITRSLPTASSLTNYADIPVDTFTGVPNIDIPLYTLPTRSKDLSVNLTLNYHPAGISFYDRATDLGVGWNLSAEGIINRTVVNEPDEYPAHSGSASYVNAYDDIYSFSFLGHTGRFKILRNIQNNTFSMQVMDNSLLKIEFDMDMQTNKINSFTIYDERGYKYFFNQVDHAYGQFWTKRIPPGTLPNKPTINYRSSHHLSNVYDNNGKEIINYGYTIFSRPFVPGSPLNVIALKLTSITSAGFGTAELHYYYTNLLDSSLSDPVQMTDVMIKDVYGNTIKKFGFTCSTTTAYFNKGRRFLDIVTEYDKTLTQVKAYNLGYKTSYTNPYQCSEDYEFGTDVYNYLTLKPKYQVGQGMYYFQGPKDQTLAEVCTVGSLEKITLPTGGRIQYEFESNTIFDVNADHSSTPLEGGNINADNYTPTVYTSTTFSTSTNTTWQFTVTGSTPKKLFLKGVATPYTSPLSDPPSKPLYPDYIISGNGITPNNFSDNYNDQTRYPCVGKMIVLSPGTYTVTINKLVGTTTSGAITITEYLLNSPLKDWSYQSGIRIKKISHYESNAATTPSRETNYIYQSFADANKSSGQMYDGHFAADIAGESTGEKIINSQIGYTNVKVYDSGNNGYTKYYYKPQDQFTAVYNPTDGSAAFTYALNYTACKTGLLEKSEVFDNTGRIITKTENAFDIVQTGDPIPQNSMSSWGGTVNSWAKLVTRISESYTYDASSTQKITQTTENFTYNSINHQIDEHIVSNSLGETVKNKSYYHTGNSTLSKNRISELEKVERYRGTELLNTSKINYANSFSGNVSYLPETIVTSKGSTSLETRVRYVDYDEFSNPLQVKQENGLITSYIWGYQKTVPIAKIENLPYANIPSATITDLQTKSNTPNNEANLLTALTALRTAFPGAMITTFTHIPLVGISTVTDPKGEKISYVYDNSGRFKEVRDKNNNILSENSYFYRGVNTTLQNYVQNKTYKIATATSIHTPTVTQANQSRTYYDGLGRAIQKTANAQSNTGKDIITHIEYNTLGLQTHEFLPFASSQNTMAYVDGVTLKANILTQYQTPDGDTNPYSEKVFEGSPLNRIMEQAAPGNDWNRNNSVKHTIRIDYQTNVSNEVKKFQATSDFTINSITFVNGSGVYYPATELHKTITKNENWKTGDGSNNTTEEFKDKEGRVVMSRKYATSMIGGVDVPAWHETYNVYDQHGNLTFVIPPKADGVITTNILDDLCYQYKYDHRNRVVEKKLPGKDWEFIVYDKLDRIVAIGPAKSPFDGLNTTGWLITKYDVFNRPVYTGWDETAATTATRAIRQAAQNGLTTTLNESKTTSGTIDGIAAYYTNGVAPTIFKLLSVHYYDTYAFPNAPATYTGIESQTAYYNTTILPKGLATGSWVRAVSTISAIAGESTFTLYDYKSRPLRTYATNYLGGYSQTDNNIDSFNGRVNYTVTRHKRLATTTEIYVKDAFTYSAQDRLISHTHQIGTSGTPQLLRKNNYNELGQLINKQVGGTDVINYVGLQKVDYNYNIRGWLLGINDVTDLKASTEKDLFAFSINYNNTIANNVGNTITPLYNGNIAETSWRTSNDNVLRRYGYQYDNMNRLKNAVYQKPNATTKVTNSYNESINYDKNGNITRLIRNGDLDAETAAITIDNLAYTYHPDKQDRLMKVFDSSNHPAGLTDDSDGITDPVDDYSYDGNGNLLTDTNKGITAITYNHLNLPVKILFNNDNNTRIEYLYNAQGEKIKKFVSQYCGQCLGGISLVTTDYLNGFQYTNGVLSFFPHAEGYVNNTYTGGTNNYNYVFNYTDHLGNIRVSYAWDIATSSLKILEENHYYPYGMKHGKYNVSTYSFIPTDDYGAGYNSGDGIPIKKGTTRNLYQYKYNGKEYQDELGLNMTAMDMRQYDPALARWVVQDPIVHQSQSPYNGYDSNPVYWADPSGGDVANSYITDDDLNQQYNKYGLWEPQSARLNRGLLSSGNDMEKTVNGKVLSSDSNGTWYQKIVGIDFQGGISYDENGTPNGITYVNIYENYYVPNVSSLDGIGQATNILGIIWGGTQLGVNKLRQGNMAKSVGSVFGIGTQVAASRLKNFADTIGKWGNKAGILGYGISVYSIGSKVLSGDTVSTSDKIGFGINTGLMIAGSIVAGTAAAPFVATAALIYGVVELGSYIYNGKTVEQNILGE